MDLFVNRVSINQVKTVRSAQQVVYHVIQAQVVKSAKVTLHFQIVNVFVSKVALLSAKNASNVFKVFTTTKHKKSALHAAQIVLFALQIRHAQFAKQTLLFLQTITHVVVIFLFN